MKSHDKACCTLPGGGMAGKSVSEAQAKQAQDDAKLVNGMTVAAAKVQAECGDGHACSGWRCQPAAEHEASGCDNEEHHAELKRKPRGKFGEEVKRGYKIRDKI